MKNKKKIFVSLIFIILLVVSFFLDTNFNKEETYTDDDTSKPKQIVNENTLSMMIEQTAGAGDYKLETRSSWPTDGYMFNATLSKCENGGELGWDETKGVITMTGNMSDKCYIYFDIYSAGVVNSVSASTTYNSITLTASATKGTNEISKYYFSIDDGSTYSESNTNTYTFSNLSENTTYKIKVKVGDTLGKVGAEYSTTATTSSYVLPKVNSFTYTATTSSLTITASATKGTNEISKYYFSIDNGTTYKESATNTYTFSSLSAGTTYTIKVKVKDSSNKESAVYSGTAKTTPISVADYCSSGTNLATCIKTFANQGSSVSKIYYHNGSLTNGINDSSYRYAGASSEVNNYVCFGSTATTCPTDNLYRIIGVFGSQVKLIKSTAASSTLLGTDGDYYSSTSYYWNKNASTNGGTNTWSYSLLNKTNLNTNYLNNIGSTWSNKIATTTWKVGGNTNANIASVVPATAYANEITNPQLGSYSKDNATTYSAQIGLMYVSDYGFAADPSAWSTVMSSYSSYKSVNWMALDSWEWTISRRADTSYIVFVVGSNGNVYDNGVSASRAVRPVFYLVSTATYSSGTGTSSNPIRIG